MLLSLIFTLCFVALGAWWYYLIAYYKSRSSLPPGPFPLPITGSLFLLGNPLHQHYARLSKKFGPIMYLRIGMVPCVVISNAHAAEEVLRVHDAKFANRPSIQGWSKYFSFDGKDVAFTPDSKSWRKMRKILNVHLFSNSMLNLSYEFRKRELEIVVTFILQLSKEGKPVDLKKVLGEWLSGSLCSTLFGRKDLDQVVELIASISDLSMRLNVGEFIPALDWFDLHGINKKMGKQLMPQVKSLLEGVIQERRRNKALAGDKFVPEGFIDVLISLDGENSLEDISIVAILCDLLAAGVDTIKEVMEWAFAEIIQNPQTMLKAQEELDRVIGKGRPVDENVISDLPYIEAIMKETLRLHPSVPLALPHFSKKEAKLGGYTIPAGCQILINLWAIGRDPQFWSNPDEFQPERFLRSHLSVTGRHFQLIPFSAGRRICIGYPLAIRSICFAVATLLHKFDWTVPAGCSTSPKVGSEDNITALSLVASPRRMDTRV